MKKVITYNSAFIVLLIILNSSFAKAQSVEENQIKTNIIAIEKPVEKLQSLEPIYYSYNAKDYGHLKLPKTPQYGFKVKSVEESFPSMIRLDTKTFTAGKNYLKNVSFKDVKNEELIPVLVAAIQEQQIAIEALKKELAELKAQK